jgi:hypothetical protein
MHLLAYWRLDNYLRDLDEGAGFNFNSRQARLHSEIQVGESLWLFTVLKNPPRYFLAARLVVRAKTVNAPGYKYGDYRVWGDLHRSRYFKVRPDVSTDEVFPLLQHLPLVSGSVAGCTRATLPQACQTIRGITAEGDRLLEQFATGLVDEDRAMRVADEYELERELTTGAEGYEKVLRRDHTGPSDQRIRQLLSLPPRNRQLVRDLRDFYAGRCQLCAFDSPVLYGVDAAEAHHVVYLSRGGEDTLINMLLLCPNHHTVIHQTDATFDYGRLAFSFPNGRIEPLCLNSHLQPRASPILAGPGTATRPAPPSLDMAALSRVIISHLTPDLLTGVWVEVHRRAEHPLTGYCYVAAEAMYHLAGGAASGLSVYRCSLPGGGTHWWLRDSDGRIVDPTGEQFTQPPYGLGVRTHFLSRQPSRRTATLIARVQAEHRLI